MTAINNTLDGERRYWSARLKGEPGIGAFPRNKYGYIDTGTPSHLEKISYRFTDETSVPLLEMVSRSPAGLFMILAAGLNAMLWLYSGQEDNIVGIPPLLKQSSSQNGRTRMPHPLTFLRCTIRPEKTFKDLLLEIKQGLSDAGRYTLYIPFEEVYAMLDLPEWRIPGRLTDISMALDGMHDLSADTAAASACFRFSIENDEIKGEVEIDTAMYSKEGAARWLSHLESFFRAVIRDPGQTLAAIDILGEAERQRVLYDFNNTCREYPSERAVHDIFHDIARSAPHAVALVNCAARPAPSIGEAHLSYAELDGLAGCLAFKLKKRGVKRGDIVAMDIRPSLERIIGVLGILKAGAAYLPLNESYPQSRRQYIMKDAAADILLGKADIPVTTDSRTFHHSGVNGSGLCYVMYTSGSTGFPKGSMIIHRNVTRLVKNTTFVKLEKGEGLLQTGPLEFDASTFEVWGGLLNGLTLYQAPKTAILEAHVLKALLLENRIHTIWLTSALFNRLSEADFTLFAPLKNLLVGGDKLSPSHINRVRDAFPHLTIINGYGPTENTTFTATFTIDGRYAHAIPIGKPISNSFVYILDSTAKPVPIGVPGELYAGGDGVSLGYMNNPELTASCFVNAKLPHGNDEQSPNSKSQCPTESDMHRGSSLVSPLERGDRKVGCVLYKTGDLAMWLPDGNIQFLGRRDFQVKIRGFRIEPGEIENALLKLDSVKECAVIVIHKVEDKHLAAYIVPSSPGILDIPGIRKKLNQRMPVYMIPTYFTVMDELPLTGNGKLDRRALPEPSETSMGSPSPHSAPSNPMEERLREIWAGLLGIEAETLPVDADFFEIGGNSLSATVMTTRIQQYLNVRLDLARVFEAPTIRELAEIIPGLPGQGPATIPVSEKRQYYPLTSGQKRLFILHRLDPESVSYNLPHLLDLGPADSIPANRIEEVIERLIERHHSLRTSFIMVDGEPVQRIHEKSALSIAPLGPLAAAGPMDDLVQPFELSQAPLLRVKLVLKEDGQAALFFDMHHIITDGVSQDILIREFKSLLRGNPLEPEQPPIQYKDYALWLNLPAQRARREAQRSYWLDIFSTAPPILNLPLDFPRQKIQRFNGSAISFMISQDRGAALEALARRRHVTMFMLLLAVYVIMLSKISGQQDIVVGTGVAGRRHPGLDNIIGFFVNTVAIRTRPAKEKKFEEYMATLKQTTLAAFENQEFPFEELVELAGNQREDGGNPIVDVFFSMENQAGQETTITSNAFEQLGEDTPNIVDPLRKSSHFDLLLTGKQTPDGIVFTFEYCTDLFKPSTMDRLIKYYKRVLNAVIDADNTSALGAIDILEKGDRGELVRSLRDKDDYRFLRHHGQDSLSEKEEPGEEAEFDF